jgi:hypothetical protein
MSTPTVDNNEKPEQEKKRLKVKTEKDAEEEAVEVESTAGGMGGSGG